MEFISKSEKDTETFAASLTAALQPGDTLCLHGDLGTGKSVFCRALIRALSHDNDLDVPSPTFTLVQTYDTRRGPVYHFDLYRLEDPEEVYELGWDDALAEGITLIEWPEKAGVFLPASARHIHIAQTGPHERKIIVDEPL
ncbi:MAG: tRNA (adenosine(37)-N6)-threonylcarbamoyltransferase complex ATPase subunit type 1 TsaE [Rhodospirillales bacterium]|nr:tRNA (adenosine(37)-N6)-threonylcarbamoyltransferase complex ATPase subunit type 1 TsaE [Rhodospirillales bacterium]